MKRIDFYEALVRIARAKYSAVESAFSISLKRLFIEYIFPNTDISNWQ